MRDQQQQRGGIRSSRSRSRSRQPAVAVPPAPVQQQQQQPQEGSTFEMYIQRPLEHVSTFFNAFATATPTPPPTAAAANTTTGKPLGKRSSTKTLDMDGGSDDSFSKDDDSITGCSLPSSKNDVDIEGVCVGIVHHNIDDDEDDDRFPPPMAMVDPIGQKNKRIRHLRRQRCILLLVILVLGILALMLGGLLSRSKKRHHQKSSASQIATGTPPTSTSNSNSSQPVPADQPTDTTSTTSSTTDDTTTSTTATGVTPPSSPSTSDTAPAVPPSENYPEDVLYYPAPEPEDETVPADADVRAPTTTTTTTSSSISLTDHCGCADCTQDVWNSDADSFTCGGRITWLHESFPLQYMTLQDACRRIAFEFPAACGMCDPARCNWIPITPFRIPEGDAWTGPDADAITQLSTEVSNPATVADLASQSLYCFPDTASGGRTEYEMWGGMKVQVKRDPAGKPCGPGDNIFSESTVAVDTNTDELTLKFINGQASEVRVLLPESQRPYTYGNYGFSIKSISVKDAQGQVIASQLPKELVLGMFTWDDTEDYASHQNWNHEVDIEVSRWNIESNADVQFLVQPPGAPQQYRFFSGQGDASEMDMQIAHSNPNWYNFTWLPGRIDWSSTAGSASADGRLHDYTLTTEEALYKGVTDYVQCMPGSSNVELRINLWNMLGAAHPVGLATTDVVEVVFDKVVFEPAGGSTTQLYLADGEFCSKTCQCSASSRCVNAKCTAV